MRPQFAVISQTLLCGCLGSERPIPLFEVVRDSVDLGEVSYLDDVPVGEFSLLNTGSTDLVLTPLGVDGEGAEFVLVASGLDYTTIPPAGSLSLEVSLEAVGSAWEEGDYTPELILELGTLWDNPRSWEDEGSWQAETLAVTVAFSLLCDLDGDGVEAVFCGGEDLDDDQMDTGVGAAPSPSGRADLVHDAVIDDDPAGAGPARGRRI